MRFLPWHTHNQVHLGATLILGLLGVAALVATVWIVVVLEVVKQRHLQLLGLARDTDVPADMPVIEAWCRSAPRQRSNAERRCGAGRGRGRGALELVETGMRLGLRLRAAPCGRPRTGWG